jgi:hypothetical protein
MGFFTTLLHERSPLIKNRPVGMILHQFELDVKKKAVIIKWQLLN